MVVDVAPEECLHCGCTHRIKVRRPEVYANTRSVEVCRHCKRKWISADDGGRFKRKKRRKNRDDISDFE